MPAGDVVEAPKTRAVIASQQFALVPCKLEKGDLHPRCFVLAAGGKYFLMGAPEGALSNLLSSEIVILDGVLLFSLLPEQVEGLDTVRNETWKRGRTEALLVAGPEGTAEFTEGLDSAFEIPDAEQFARNSPAGGYDASLMKALEVSLQRDAGTLIVNTGDLLVRGFYAPSGDIVYQAEYSGQIVGIGRCGNEIDQGFLAEISGSEFPSLCGGSGEIVYIIE